MFFYISFLRPPPSTASPSGKLIIVPQIANDLRTEFFDGTQDIFYSWQSPGLPQTSKTKLTTWRQETTYKELVVPLPGGSREGQTWRLILSAGDTAVNLTDVKLLGQTPFGVLSMPIKISRLNNGKKQEQIERVYTLGANVGLKITEQTSYDLDKVRVRLYGMDRG